MRLNCILNQTTRYFTVFILLCWLTNSQANESAALEEPDSFDSYGYLAFQSGLVKSQPSWLSGGFGRLDAGSHSNKYSSFHDYTFSLALEWSPNPNFLAYLHGLARKPEKHSSGENYGVVEAFVESAIYFSESETGGNEIALQLGQFFFPSSQENTLPLWQSPYTLTFSSWNSWLAHELRPFSLNLGYRALDFDGEPQFKAQIGVFRGADSMASQLAWGGWRMSRRLSVYNEVLPLGDLFSLRESGLFEVQRDDGSKPIGYDLDGKLGHHLNLQWQANPALLFKLNYLDNNGSRELYRGQYAWETSFYNLGFHYQLQSDWELLGEYSEGEMGMGNSIMGVQVDFDNGYIMASWKQEAHRVSLRYEKFNLYERDFSPGEINDDKGSAWTMAWLYQLQSSWQLGVELLQLNSKNAAQAQSGFPYRNREAMLSLALKRRFG